MHLAGSLEKSRGVKRCLVQTYADIDVDESEEAEEEEEEENDEAANVSISSFVDFDEKGDKSTEKEGVPQTLQNAIRELTVSVRNLDKHANDVAKECKRKPKIPFLLRLPSERSWSARYAPLDSVARASHSPCGVRITILKIFPRSIHQPITKRGGDDGGGGGEDPSLCLILRCGSRTCRGKITRRVSRRVLTSTTTTTAAIPWGEHFDFQFASRSECDRAKIDIDAIVFDGGDDNDDDLDRETLLLGSVRLEHLGRGTKRIRKLDLTRRHDERTRPTTSVGEIWVTLEAPCTLLIEIIGGAHIPSHFGGGKSYVQVQCGDRELRTDTAKYGASTESVEWGNNCMALHFANWRDCVSTDIVFTCFARRFLRDVALCSGTVRNLPDGNTFVDLASDTGGAPRIASAAGTSAPSIAIRVKSITGIASPWKAI
eukprot:g1253.t1